MKKSSTVTAIKKLTGAMVGIPPRHIDFRFPESMPKYFYAGNATATTFFAMLSGFFPPGERYFMESVRQFRDRVKDDNQRAAISGFMGQEAIHGREHDRLNELLAERGFDMKAPDRFVRIGLAVLEKLPASTRLAATTFMEHFTALLAEQLLEDEQFRQQADPEMIKIGSGSAGFDFTKLERNGNPLSSSASSWSCVRDNVTGLVWEVKTADGGLRDAAHTYSWFNGSGANDGGFPGTENGGICAGGTGCDIEKFVHDVNSDTLCGIDNWRVPTPSELVGIASFDRKNPAIDTDYFPNTAGVSYWTSASYADYAYGVVFGPGFIGDGNKSSALSARLVGAPL